MGSSFILQLLLLSLVHARIEGSAIESNTAEVTIDTGLPSANGVAVQQSTAANTRRLDDSSSSSSSSSTSSSSSNSDSDKDAMEFPHFVAHNKTMTCTADEHARPFNNQIRGVNLGGWMVLEPWITPSLFYQFLGKSEGEVAFDMYTFCEVLGPVEGNKQLRHHWETWVTEEIVDQLAKSDAVNSFRLPVGDFQFVEYGPYKGCVDGGLEYIDQLLDWAYARGITVLIDVHTMKDSQNGFDNSGQSMGFQWTSSLTPEFGGLSTFEHWPIRTANWVGKFDPVDASYKSINYDNIEHALEVIRRIVKRYKSHPAVLGLEPLNEPWQYTPLDILKRFYWEGYLIVKSEAQYWKYIMHDSFRLTVWGGFMDGCPERALDTHMYQAWMDPDTKQGYFTDACRSKGGIAQMEREFGPVIVGEWSLATDNCAMWLNGFNDNLPGFPRLPCKYTPCRESYLGTEQPGNPIDPSKPLQGPYGSGMSGPIFGLCPGSRDWLKDRQSHPLTGQDWIRAPPNAPKQLDDTDDVMSRLALKKIQAFSGIGHGFFFWNFRTDLYEPEWSYMEALDRGWIPKGNLNDEHILNACKREDSGEYKCILKRGQLETNIKNALSYIFKAENITDTPPAQKLMNSTGPDLENGAMNVISDFFDANRLNGVTCDFGGIAQLVEQNVTYSPSADYDDDYYYTTIVREGPALWKLILYGSGIALIAALLGFVIAMRTNAGFNRRVRSTALFMPLTKSSNSLLRSSLALPDLNLEYEELVKGGDDHSYRSYGAPSF